MNRTVPALIILLAALMFSPSTMTAEESKPDGLRIGWASVDITPDRPVTLQGHFAARISDGVMDPVTATALALESIKNGVMEDWAVMVSCDLISIHDKLIERVRERLPAILPGLDPTKVFVNATHTHAAPSLGARLQEYDAAFAKEFGWELPFEWADWGAVLDAMPGIEYREFAAERIVAAIEQAWKSRKPGGVAFGLGHAVVGHNRLTAYAGGRSQMYGPTNLSEFSHVEGYEDHGVNLLYTWDAAKRLTGVLINIACPSQVAGGNRISADFWHETREELRRRLGEDLFVLPQCSAAGDQSPAILVGQKAEARMERLAGRNRRQQIAVCIADAVTSVLPHVERHIETNPAFAHRVEQVELTRSTVSEQDVAAAEPGLKQWRERYAQARRAIEENPTFRETAGWHVDITQAYRRTMREARVGERFQLQQGQPKVPYEVHVVRIGDMVMATSPFELYLDYGVQMKARSKAIQTFIVQLTGAGTYLPTTRSLAGGAYGAAPASTDVGPEGGRELVEQTLELIDSLWAEN